IRANRRAASLALRPKGEASSLRRTSSAGKECHSSAIVRRTRARVIKVVPDIRRIRAIRRPFRLDNAYLYDESRCDPSGWEPRFSRGRFQRPRSPRTRTGKRVLVIETTSIMLEVAVIASVGFVGAAIASRVRLPIIIGYIIAGFVIGAWLGWPVIDTMFMAGVIGMSSSAIAAKSLIDLKRLGNKETEFLLGMVILESFLAMFILTLANGMILPSQTPVDVT